MCYITFYLSALALKMGKEKSGRGGGPSIKKDHLWHLTVRGSILLDGKTGQNSDLGKFIEGFVRTILASVHPPWSIAQDDDDLFFFFFLITSMHSSYW